MTEVNPAEPTTLPPSGPPAPVPRGAARKGPPSRGANPLVGPWLAVAVAVGVLVAGLAIVLLLRL